MNDDHQTSQLDLLFVLTNYHSLQSSLTSILYVSVFCFIKWGKEKRDVYRVAAQQIWLFCFLLKHQSHSFHCQQLINHTDCFPTVSQSQWSDSGFKLLSRLHKHRSVLSETAMILNMTQHDSTAQCCRFIPLLQTLHIDGFPQLLFIGTAPLLHRLFFLQGKCPATLRPCWPYWSRQVLSLDAQCGTVALYGFVASFKSKRCSETLLTRAEPHLNGIKWDD